MFVRIGLVAVALALLAMLLLGIGAISGFVRINSLSPGGIAFGFDKSTEVAPTDSKVVSADDLLKQKGIQFANPQQPADPTTAPATPPAPDSSTLASGQQSQNAANVPGAEGPRKGGIIRVTAGSKVPLTDPDGNVWEAANGFVGGEISDRGPITIGNTRFSALHRYERWNVESWHCRLPNGQYTVLLHFAETGDNVQSSKQRVFAVSVQGERLYAIDIYRETGGLRRELIRSASAQVTDGTLTVDFHPLGHLFTLIGGIEVIPDGPVAAKQPPRDEGSHRFSELRIAAGSSAALRDPDGKTWFADTGFDGGKTVERGDIRIADTDFPQIYRNERFGMTAWHADVPNGAYVVKLHFGETSPDVNRAGQRVFNVIVQDQPLRDFDVFHESGGKNHALVKTFYVDIQNGRLSILFQAIARDKNVPEINGIEVIRKK